MFIHIPLLYCVDIRTNYHVRPRPAVWRSSQLRDTPHSQPLGGERTFPAWWTCIDRPRDKVPFLPQARRGGLQRLSGKITQLTTKTIMKQKQIEQLQLV
jgi:hypothetical protein